MNPRKKPSVSIFYVSRNKSINFGTISLGPFKLCISFFYVVFAMNWLFLSEDNFRVYIPYKNVIWEDYSKSQSVICNPLYKCRLEGHSSREKYE